MNELQAEVYEKLSTLQWLLQRRRFATGAAHRPIADPTRGQGRVLAFLRMQPEISTKDLSYLLGIRQQSLNELLNKLEKSGLVVRKPSEEDKRVMIVHLTEKGKEAQPEDDTYDDIFNCLEEEELATFNSYLDRIINALQDEVGDPREDLEKWMNAARERMGDERFERLMEMKSSFCGGFVPEGFDQFARGGMPHRPKPKPGSERFNYDCGGPIPEGRVDISVDWRCKDERRPNPKGEDKE
ncbi:MAG: MarR family winged helix-turn-helix transcriptional regulator [Raoultibacter sp.]|jgi:DNA-binding MarR family transcriptional regulator